jgi:hypothetical protein
MDVNVRAFRTVQEAINEHSNEVSAKKSASRKGGLKGGKARAASLTPEKRASIAKKASAVRWHKSQ